MILNIQNLVDLFLLQLADMVKNCKNYENMVNTFIRQNIGNSFTVNTEIVVDEETKTVTVRTSVKFNNEELYKKFKNYIETG